MHRALFATGEEVEVGIEGGELLAATLDCFDFASSLALAFISEITKVSIMVE